MRPQLVGAPGHRLERNEAGLAPKGLENGEEGRGGLPAIGIHDHLLGAAAAGLGERGVDHPPGGVGDAQHQGKVDLQMPPLPALPPGALGLEPPGEAARGHDARRHHHHTRRVPVEAVHQPGRFLPGERHLERAVDVVGRSRPALAREARGFVDGDPAVPPGYLGPPHQFDHRRVGGASGGRLAAGGRHIEGGGHGDHLALGESGGGFRLGAVDANGPRAEELLDPALVDALELPADEPVEPGAVLGAGYG